MSRREVSKELRCFCARKPLLATYGIDTDGKLYIHVKIWKAQRIFGETGEYVFHPEVEHKFKKDVKDDQIVTMKLPTNEEMESWIKKFREMFR